MIPRFHWPSFVRGRFPPSKQELGATTHVAHSFAQTLPSKMISNASMIYMTPHQPRAMQAMSPAQHETGVDIVIRDFSTVQLFCTDPRNLGTILFCDVEVSVGDAARHLPVLTKICMGRLRWARPEPLAEIVLSADLQHLGPGLVSYSSTDSGGRILQRIVHCNISYSAHLRGQANGWFLKNSFFRLPEEVQVDIFRLITTRWLSESDVGQTAGGHLRNDRIN
ncbi:hypothetical protein B0H14DRAFT_2697165 [Mycena olivaceomarginata]|nr:hypothetical protein B0H14DRAFT_2697165 [Mycena olivaceomarginata]